MQKVLSILSVLSVSCKCKNVIIMRSLKGEVQNDVPIRCLSEIDPHQQSTCSFCSADVRVRSAHSKMWRVHSVKQWSASHRMLILRHDFVFNLSKLVLDQYFIIHLLIYCAVSLGLWYISALCQ